MKLLASDLDGTLLFHDEEGNYFLKDEDVKAIQRFQKDGHLFGVCTGRHIKGVVDWEQGFHFDFYILTSGAVILNGKREIIKAYTIKKQQVIDIMNFVGDACATFIYNNAMYAMNPSGHYTKFKVLESLDELPDELEGFSLHYVDDVEKTTSVINQIKEKFKDISAYQNIDNIDMCNKNCSKGNGLKEVIQYFNADKDDMHVIGDSWNDIPMFDECENSFTFNSSPKEIHLKTKYQVNSIAECIDIID